MKPKDNDRENKNDKTKKSTSRKRRRKTGVPKPTDADRVANQKGGKIGRKRLVDMAALRSAIMKCSKYKSLEDFFRNCHAISKNTLRQLKNPPFMIRGSCVEEIAIDLGVDDVKHLLVNPPEEVEPNNHRAEVVRKTVFAYGFGVHCDQFVQGPNGELTRQNVWPEIIGLPIVQDLKVTLIEIQNEFLKLCRDGVYLQHGPYDFRIRSHDNAQVTRLVQGFRGITTLLIRQNWEFANECEAAKSFLMEALDVAITAARSRVREGLNFRSARRRFFSAFGLELGSQVDSIATNLDAADQPLLQVRYLLKLKHGSPNNLYRNEIEALHRPLLNDMEKIFAIIQEGKPDIDHLNDIVMAHPGNIDDLIQRRDRLLLELKRSGKFNYYDI